MLLEAPFDSSKPLSDPVLLEWFTANVVVDAADMPALLLEYARFMQLQSSSALPLAPSKPVDSVWHAHIQYSRHYEKYCDYLGQRFLHHVPTSDRATSNALYARTLEKYVQTFQRIPPRRWWPRPDQLDQHLRNLHSTNVTGHGASSTGYAAGCSGASCFATSGSSDAFGMQPAAVIADEAIADAEFGGVEMFEGTSDDFGGDCSGGGGGDCGGCGGD